MMECHLDKITVHYETVGEGTPVLMLHGWPLDHRSLASDLEPIFTRRPGWKRIYLDLPGMGKTPGKAWITHQDHVLEVVLDFIEQVISSQCFVVVGESYGGYLARGITYHKAALMEGLLLIVPRILAGDAEKDVSPNATLIKNPELVAELAPEDVEIFTDCEQMIAVQSRAILQKLKTEIFPAIDAADHAFLDRLSTTRDTSSFSFDVDALAQPFAKPTLMLMGRQDSACGYRDAWKIVENYPRGTFAVLDRAGHSLSVEQQSLYHHLVNEWLDRVEEHMKRSDSDMEQLVRPGNTREV